MIVIVTKFNIFYKIKNSFDFGPGCFGNCLKNKKLFMELHLVLLLAWSKITAIHEGDITVNLCLIIPHVCLELATLKSSPINRSIKHSCDFVFSLFTEQVGIYRYFCQKFVLRVDKLFNAYFFVNPTCSAIANVRA